MNSGDDCVVISGISGRFPKSRNVEEFKENLYNKVDMIDDDETRWKNIYPNVPPRFGKTVDLNKFDSTFFIVSRAQAEAMDPQMRTLLEHSYECILDAGVSPQSLIGTNTAVIVACSQCDMKESIMREVNTAKEGIVFLGTSPFFLANRLSYTLGLCGPSFVVDVACSSTASALDMAYQYMQSGACDAALVGGCQLMLNTKPFKEFSGINALSPDGLSKPFDKDASGFVCADTVGAIFLQKRKYAKRIYAHLIHSRSTNDGFKQGGQLLGSIERQHELMAELYKTIDFNPNDVKYLEAHATGTVMGDYQELSAIDEVFCKNSNRSDKLIIGSVKSNMGHSIAASALASIAKIIIAFENQDFPPNINLSNLRDDVSAFNEGRIEVATDAIKLTSDYIAMNSFGIGGSNVHILFKQNTNEKINFGIPNDDLERVVLWSGRSEEAVNAIYDDIKKRPLDAEHIALLQNSQILTPDANTYRGYAMFKNDDTANCIKRNIQEFNGIRRPVVFVYSGVGSQWHEMGRDLMKIPLFAKSIDKCHEILLKYDLDLKEIINSSDVNIYQNLLSSYIGIISIEVALTDVIEALGIKSDFIIGHSVGEIGCAYADECITMEQALTIAYLRAKLTIECNEVEGGMAAIGMHHSEIEKILPKTIDIACHNSAQSTTISGPKDQVNEFIKKLAAKKVFAKEVQSTGIAFHSRYIKSAALILTKLLSKLITKPKIRSSKWISSTYLQDNDKARTCNAKYFADNLKNPVFFEEAMEQLPKNAITIEISPHGLFKSILKSSLNESIYVDLANKGRNGEKIDGKIYFIEQLGRLFQAGVDINIAALYPSVEFPVSRATPMISPLIKWNHNENFSIECAHMEKTFERFTKIININDSNFEFLKDHVIDGIILIPGSFWIHLIWESFGYMHGIHYENLKVTFEDLEFLRAVRAFSNRDVIVTITISNKTGRFEIVESDTIIFTGRIYRNVDVESFDLKAVENHNANTLNSKDFYKLAQIRGYYHGKSFQGIESIRSDGLFAIVKADVNWAILFDLIFQCEIVRLTSNGLFVPHKFLKFTIDPFVHRAKIFNSKLQVKASEELSSVICGGVRIDHFKFMQINRKKEKQPLMESYKFQPFIFDANSKTYKHEEALRIIFLTHMNVQNASYTFIEINSDGENLSSNYLSTLSKKVPVDLHLILLTSKEIEIDGVEVISDKGIDSFSNVDLIFKNNCINDVSFLESIESSLSDNGFLVTQEDSTVEIINENIEVLSRINLNSEKILLMTKFRKIREKINYKVIEIKTNVGEWLESLKNAFANEDNILIYSQTSSINDCTGIIGLFNCLLLESIGKKLKCFLIYDKNTPKFDINNPFYATQIEKHCAMNVYKNGQWGCNVHLEIDSNDELKPQLGQCYLNYLKRGDLSSLKWLQGSITDLSDDLIKVQYSSMNFKDIVHALGYIDDGLNVKKQCAIGLEFAGIKMSSNERVMGMMKNSCGGFSTYIPAKDTIEFKVPNAWTLEDAATVPVVYTTVYHSFFFATQIQRGKSILIHSGAGGVGQAALHIAFAYNLEVFTTVGTEEKRKFLLENFPHLKAENIGNSRDLSFEEMVMKMTKGKGVDYVLNSLSGDKLKASLRCLGEDGVFLEIGRYDVEQGTEIGLDFLMKNIAIKFIRIDKLNMSNDSHIKLFDKMQVDINSGVIKPITRTVFDASTAEKAFRFMTSGNHIGKVLLRIREDERNEESLPINVQPRVYCNPQCSYVLIGCLGGMGLELCEWLITRGCRKMILSSRRGISDQYQAHKINKFKSYGVEVIISTADVTTKSGCEELLMGALKLGPIEGIFNLAVVLNDAIFINQTEAMFNKTLASKAIATKYLHEKSLKYCPKLKHFVVFSSIASGRGSVSQTNYGMANSVMDEIMEMRHEMNLPAKAIQWGPVKDIGLLSHTQSDTFGILSMISLATYLQSLDILLLNSNAIVGCFGGVEKKSKITSNKSFIDTFMSMLNITDRKSISMSSTLTQLGIDSIASIEVQHFLQKIYGIAITAKDLRTMTISELEKKTINNAN